MFTLDDLKLKIEQGLPGSNVEILDPRNDGVHIKAVVIWKGFEGKSLIEQHRLVNNIVKQHIDNEELHALGIQTKVE